MFNVDGIPYAGFHDFGVRGMEVRVSKPHHGPASLGGAFRKFKLIIAIAQ